LPAVPVVAAGLLPVASLPAVASLFPASTFGVAASSEPAAPDVLRRPPRPPAAGIFDRALVVRVATTAGVLCAVSLALAAVSSAHDGPWQTQLFVVLTVGQLGLALAARPPGAWRARMRAQWVPVAVALSGLLLLAGVYLPWLRDLLGTEPLSGTELGLAVLAGLVPGLLAAAAGARRSADGRSGE